MIDWVMRKVIDDRTGIRWNLFKQLEDLEFADDICLITEHRNHMQAKIDKLAQYSDTIGLRINTEKTKLLKNNNHPNNKIMINGKEVEEVDKFTYLGSVMERSGGCKKDIQTRITKAQHAFNALNKIWQTNEISETTKIKIFNSCIKSILLYGAETWKQDENTTKKLQTFVNKSLRKILKIYWPNKITNTELWERTKQTNVSTTVKEKKWKWIGHTLRKDQSSIARQALEYQPEGKRKRGRPDNSWKRTTTREHEKIGLRWGEVKKRAKDRREWRELVHNLSRE